MPTESSGSALPPDVPPGDIALGPADGTLRLRTSREGIAARAGHDLLLAATAWRGRVHVPAGPAEGLHLEVEVDLRSLEVLEGTGGVKPLSAADRAEIQKAMHKTLGTDHHPLATFRSSAISITGDEAAVLGELFLAGRSHPLELDVRRNADGSLRGTTRVVQTTWGIKPYSGLFGTLKVRDAVDVEVEVRLPGTTSMR